MLEAKTKAIALLQDAGNSNKFDDQLPHIVSDIVEELGKLTVPLRSSMLIGEGISQSIDNYELVRSTVVTSISDACTQLSEQRLSPMERVEITLQLQEKLGQEIRVLGEFRSSTQNIVDSESLVEAQETLRALERAIVINNSRLGSVDRIRVPYELGGEYLSINSTLKSLPTELRTIVENLLDDDFSRRGEAAVSCDFRAAIETMSEYPLDSKDRQNLLKCIALVSKDLNLQSLAIKEYFRNLLPEDHSIVVERMLAVGKPGNPSLFLSHFQDHLSETFANKGGAWSGTSDTLLTLTNLANLIDRGSKFENIGASVHSAIYAVRKTNGVTEEIAQVAEQLSSLIAQKYGDESSTYRKFLLDFNLVEPTLWENLKSALKGFVE
jgi:hypothetical protein